MARARHGNSIKTKLGFLIYGDFGTWKSSLALQFAKMHREDGKPFRVLYLDAENGSVDTYIDRYAEEGVAVENIYIVYTQSLKEVMQYIKKAAKNEDLYELDENGEVTDQVVLDADGKPFRADAIVIDSATVLYMATQQGLTEFSKLRAKVKADDDKDMTSLKRKVKIQGAGLELKDYNTIKFDGQDLALSLMGSGKHFAIIARETDEKKATKDEKTGAISSVATGKKITDGFKDIAYNVKTVIHTFETDLGEIQAIVENKDRTGVHERGALLENPSLLDWEVVIAKNKGKKDFVIPNEIKNAVQIEKDFYAGKEGIEDKDNKNIEGDSNETVESLINTAASIVSNLTKLQKKTLAPLLREAGLPVQYKTLSKDQLKRYIEIVSKINK